MINPKDVMAEIDVGEKLFSTQERLNVETKWKEIAEFVMPNQFGIFQAGTSVADSAKSSNPGAKNTRRLYDSTATQAVLDLASAFQGTLTNPATIWSKMRFQGKELQDSTEAKSWLEATNKIMHNEINESNFNTEIARGYQSFTSLGNMVLLLENGEDKTFRLTSMHVAQVAWTENKEGMVDTLYRKFSLTAKQAFERWGKKTDKAIQNVLEHDPFKEFSFMHAIYPRDPKEIKLNEVGLAPGHQRPIVSAYFDTQHKKLMEEDGFYEMAVFVPRWSLAPNEKYGRGPAETAIPFIRSLNKLQELDLTVASLQARPAILVNSRDVFGSVDVRSGQISVVKDHKGVKSFGGDARLDGTINRIDRLTKAIKEIFFLDKLLLPPRTETGEMTAFEVSQRVEQVHRVLGPTLARMSNELLNPMIVRMFKMLLRSGKLPEMPSILKERGLDIEIVFVNQLARAQQIQDVTSIQQWLQVVDQIAQFDPSARHAVKGPELAQHVATVLGTPEVGVSNEDEILAKVQAEQQAAQQAQAMEMAQGAADISSKVDTGE